MSDQTISRLPDRDNLKRQIRKLHCNNDFKAIPNDPSFIFIPTVLCKAQCESQFLRCDTGPSMLFNILVIMYHTFFCRLLI
jgi:hypothetical protein